jgi:hypothetical protein
MLKRRLVYFMAFCIGLGILYMFNPIDNIWTPKCPFKLLTGLSCPGCGLQRALHALLHGRIAEAAAFNYWLLFALPYLLALVVQRLMPAGRTREKAGRLLEHRYLITFYIVSFFVWFVIRNIYHI